VRIDFFHAGSSPLQGGPASDVPNPTQTSASGRALKVLIATPYGPTGRGGIDVLTNLIVDTVEHDPGLGVRARSVTTYGPEIKALMPFVFLASLFQVAVAKLRAEVDVLHVNVAWGGSVYRKAVLVRFARLLGIPYVIHIHGSRFHKTWPSRWGVLRRAVDRMLLGSSAIIVLGEYWSNHVKKNLPTAHKKIHILPNATPKSAVTGHYDRAEHPVRITFLGALGERKGTLQLIEALSRLAGMPNWQATIAGNGDIPLHQERAKELGIAERLEFPGWLDRARVDHLLKNTDIFVLPSFAENLPMSILEAFSHGVPVISTSVGAIPEILEPGVTGLLTPPGDVDALSQALRRLVEQPDLRVTMGNAARQVHAARFDSSPYVKYLSGIWRSAAASVSESAGQVRHRVNTPVRHAIPGQVVRREAVK
jgi:glycosyltransferase involved in cell wall biosynthesis